MSLLSGSELYQQNVVQHNYATIAGGHQIPGNAAGMRTVHAASQQLQTDSAKQQHMANYGNARANSQPRLQQATTNRQQVTALPVQGNYITAPMHGQMHGQIAYNQSVQPNTFVAAPAPQMAPVMYSAQFNPAVAPFYVSAGFRPQIYHQPRLNYPSQPVVPASIPQPTVMTNPPSIPQQQNTSQRVNRPRTNAIPIIDPNTQKEVTVDTEQQDTSSTVSASDNEYSDQTSDNIGPGATYPPLEQIDQGGNCYIVIQPETPVVSATAMTDSPDITPKPSVSKKKK